MNLDACRGAGEQKKGRSSAAGNEWRNMRRVAVAFILGTLVIPSSTKPVSVPVFIASRVSRGSSRVEVAVTPAKATDHVTLPFSGLTVVQLKDLLRENGLPVSGKKSDLIQRIAEHSSPRDDPHPISNPSSDQEHLSTLDDPHPSSNPSSNQEDEEILGGLTVPQLKARLKDLGLPISGRKKELINRILEHVDPQVGNSVELDGEYNDSDEVASVVSDLDVEDSVELDGEEGGGLGKTSDLDEAISGEGLGENLSGLLEEILNESASVDGDVDDDETKDDSRKARRKKYWKTSEVKEMIRSNDPQASAKAEELIE